MRLSTVGLACVAIGLLPLSAKAQWTADPAANTLVAGGAGIQAKVRLSATSDGGAYVAWWQSEDAPVYWSLRLNRLTRAGVKAWPTDVVVASNSASTTLAAATVNGSFYDVNYDLKTDAQGRAVLVWTDFRTLSTRNVFAQRIGPGGIPDWTPGGVAITNDSSFKRDPRVVQMTDGRYALAWFASTSPPSIRLQVLADDGTPALPAGGQAIVAATTASRPPDRFELAPGDAGSVIAAWIREFSTSSSAQRWVVAQKFRPGLTAALFFGAWNGGQPVTVSAQNIGVQTQTIPFATNYPRVALASTPGGGCVVACFDSRTGGQNVYAQRLSPAGDALWAVDGVPVATSTVRVRIEPAIAFDPASDALWVFSREISLNAGTEAIGVQRLDASGTRTLGDAGLLVAPPSASFKYAMRASVSGDGAVAIWTDEAQATPGSQTIAAARVGPSGATTWAGGFAQLATTPSNKVFVQHPLDTSPPASVARDGFAIALGYPTGLIAAWQDTRSGDADVYSQQINTCGTLGQLGLADFNGSGSRGVDDIFAFLSAWFANNPLADATGDGVRDVSDIFAFLSAWFAGC